MPRSKRPKPIYQRGDFKLYRRADRDNFEIVWYDVDRKRERSISAGTSDHEAARIAVDREYLTATGQRHCATCGRPFDGAAAPLLSRAIADYLILSADKPGLAATRGRLAHVVDYVAETNAGITCAQVDRSWVDGFRKWLATKPVAIGKTGRTRARSVSHVEGCVLQLAAAINATPGQRATFASEQMMAVAASPTYRADVATIAAMFRYCLHPTGPKIRSEKERQVYVGYRANLLRYLRVAVATWARPEEIFDLGSKGPGQWIAEARVLNLNPPGRRQTRKYRTRIPIPHQFAPHLADLDEAQMPVSTIRKPWEDMRAELGMPADRQAGPKLIRRSMSTIVRRRIGEANWRQGEMMLGHVKSSISDVYAIPDPANLGLALAATEAIIAEIEALTPGAHREITAITPALSLVNGRLSR